MTPLAVRAGRNLAVALPVVAMDQASKRLAATALARGELIEILPFANLHLGFNKGISFGLLPAGSPAGLAMLVGVALLIVVGLCVWSVATRDLREGLALSLVIGGAVGNLIDRIRAGMVTDFIDLHSAGYHWPMPIVLPCPVGSVCAYPQALDRRSRTRLIAN
jgi:signal peptidase II